MPPSATLAAVALVAAVYAVQFPTSVPRLVDAELRNPDSYYKLVLLRDRVTCLVELRTITPHDRDGCAGTGKRGCDRSANATITARDDRVPACEIAGFVGHVGRHDQRPPRIHGARAIERLG